MPRLHQGIKSEDVEAQNAGRECLCLLHFECVLYSGTKSPWKPGHLERTAADGESLAAHTSHKLAKHKQRN